LRMVPKGLAPVRRAVSTTVRMAASPSAAHIARYPLGTPLVKAAVVVPSGCQAAI
jgi:hypothetical protein